MIDDQNHPEWQAIEEALAKQALAIRVTNGFCGRTIEMIQELCDDARRKAWINGVAFPRCVVVYFLQSQQIRIFDRDADHARKQGYIVRLIRDGIEPADIADGFKRAWPDYKPDVAERKASMKKLEN